MVLRFGLVELGVGADDDDVAALNQPGGGTVDADVARAAEDDVGREARAGVAVVDLDLLVRQDAGRRA